MTFRFARHTGNLEQLVHFYTTILDFAILGHFEDHDGYNGVFLGRKGAAWHLEFTTSVTPPAHRFDEDDALVFYPDNRSDYDAICSRIQQQQLPLLIPKNPYWQQHGLMISDPDGYNIIICPLQAQ